MNHKQLRHPHIVELREVRMSARLLLREAQKLSYLSCRHMKDHPVLVVAMRNLLLGYFHSSAIQDILVWRGNGLAKLTGLASAGIPNSRVSGNCHGVRDGWRHVSAGGTAAGPAGEGCAVVLPAAHYCRRLLPQNGELGDVDVRGHFLLARHVHLEHCLRPGLLHFWRGKQTGSPIDQDKVHDVPGGCQQRHQVGEHTA